MKIGTSRQQTLCTWICTAMVLTSLMAAMGMAMPPHERVQARVDRGEVRLPANPLVLGYDRAVAKQIPSGMIFSPGYTGTFKTLCILVDFSDNTAQTDAYKFDTLIFANQSGTVHDYYDEVSYAQIDIVTVNLPSALGWTRAPQTYAYYVDNNYGTDSPYPNNTQKLCEDMVDAVDAAVDFSQYDNDLDGYVDVVMIAHAGPGAEYTGSSSDIWSHKWSISPRRLDNVYIFDYTIMPEYWISPGDMTIGVYCHELGHVFGLPDIYDTDGSSWGTGYWSLMSSGSWNGTLGSSPAHFDAWCKTQLGWVTETNVTDNLTNVSIPQVETNATVYRLWTSGAGGDEYFLVENRQQVGYDAALPGSGLLIWHIDNAVGHNRNEWYPGHTSSGHYMVALEQADNSYHLEQKTNAGNAGDPFPGSTGNTSFSPVSSPNSNSYSASNSYVAITTISPSQATMTADFAIQLASDVDDDVAAVPQFDLGQNYPNPFNPATTISYTLSTAGKAEIIVYDVLGRAIRHLVSGEQSAGRHTVTWAGTDDSGDGVPSGVYFYELITETDRATRKMLMVK